MSFSDSERQLLADLFLEVGPEAPTLCAGWTTTDLAAHLWVREHRPDAAAGMVISPLKNHLASVQNKVKKQDYAKLVEHWRAGPPKFSPLRLADRTMNAAEHFVHHEDVRRARSSWSPRVLEATATAALSKSLSLLAKVLLRHSELPVILSPTNLAPLTVGGARGVVDHGDAVARVSGDIGELVLWVFGRDTVDVETSGNTAKIVRSSL